MDDQLEAIVQRMLDAGESENDIASVIKEYHSARTGPRFGDAPTAAAMLTRQVGADTGIAPTGGLDEQLRTMLRPLVNPQSLGDFALLSIPAGMGRLITGTIGRYASAAKMAAQEAQNLRRFPGAMIRTLSQNAFDVARPADRALNDLPLYKQMEYLPEARSAPIAMRGAGPPVTGIPRGPTIQGVSVDDLRRTGVGEPAIQATLRGQTGRFQTAGSGAAVPTEPPRVAATPTSASPAPLTLIEHGANAFINRPLTVNEVAENMRRMYGSEKAGRMLNPVNAREGASAIRRLAPGPSRLPLVKDLADLDQRYRFQLQNPNATILPPLAFASMLRHALIRGMKSTSTERSE